MGLPRLKPSWRKVFSDLWSNKARTALVVASIAVGVFAVGMIAGAYFIIPGDMNASFSSANPSNIKIMTGPFDQDLIDAIERLEGVAQAQGTRTVSARLQTGPDTWTSISLVAYSTFDAERINAQRYLSGATVPGEREALLEEDTAEKYGAGPGDVLVIELEDGTRRELRVAGVAQDLTSGIGGMFDNPTGYILEDTIEWLHEPDYFNQLDVTVSGDANDPAHIEAVAARVTDRLEKTGREVYQVKLTEKNHHPLGSILNALLRILMVLGVLIVFLSGSLISNTLTALLNQHMQQIGIMKLVGARGRQIIGMYLALILVFGVIALAIALPAGAWAAYALSAFAANLIGFPLRGFRVIPSALAIQAVIALTVPLISGALPVLSGARVTVVQAINSSSAAAGRAVKKTVLDRILGRVKGISRPLLVSIRNTFRRKGRLALTLLTLTLGGAIFISVFNVQVSLNKNTEQISKYFSADVNLDFSRDYPVEQVKRIASSARGVKTVEAWRMTQGEVARTDGQTGETVSLLAPPAGSRLVKPILMTGRWILEGDEGALTVNEAFLRHYPGLRVGDSLSLKVDGRTTDWRVVGIFQFTGVDELIAYTSYDYLANYLNQPSRTSTYRIESDDHSLAAQVDLGNRLDSLFREQGMKVNQVEAGGAFTSSMTEYMGILTAFLLVMAMLTAVVGSIGMAGTLSMNVLERTREIGVLRAIGAHNGVILRLVLIEGLLIGLISFLFGSLLSFPITAVLAEVVSQAIFNTSASYALTLQGFVIWLAVVLALSVLASLAPARRASSMTIREVLAYE